MGTRAKDQLKVERVMADKRPEAVFGLYRDAFRDIKDKSLFL